MSGRRGGGHPKWKQATSWRQPAKGPDGQAFVATVQEILGATVTDKAFVPGTTLNGCGIDPTVKHGVERDVYGTHGNGTKEDPKVVWLYDHSKIRGLGLVQDHIAIARATAMAHGFECIHIRAKSHNLQLTYQPDGSRTYYTAVTGEQKLSTTPCDPHLTVYMGKDQTNAMVSGHIYVIETTDPDTGLIRIAPMTDPASQRTIIHPGYERVAEEFWLVRDAWPVA